VTTPWIRPGEEFLKIRDDDPGNCTVCGKPLIEAWFRWTSRRNQPDDPYPTDGRFPSLRHADGSPNHDLVGGLMAKNRCPECKGEQLDYQDTGYGWTARCPCGWHKYTDSGD
jgi:hypothetical protein